MRPAFEPSNSIGAGVICVVALKLKHIVGADFSNANSHEYREQPKSKLLPTVIYFSEFLYSFDIGPTKSPAGAGLSARR